MLLHAFSKIQEYFLQNFNSQVNKIDETNFVFSFSQMSVIIVAEYLLKVLSLWTHADYTVVFDLLRLHIFGNLASLALTMVDTTFHFQLQIISWFSLLEIFIHLWLFAMC